MNLHKRPETLSDYILPPIIGFGFIFVLTVIFLVDGYFDEHREMLAAVEKRDRVEEKYADLQNRYDSLEYQSQLKDPRTLWLARAIYSETDRPEEMYYVAWVIRNRVELKFRGKTTYRDVILDTKQFSAFNRGRTFRFYYATKGFEDIHEKTRLAGVWRAAIENARMVIFGDPENRPFPKHTLYFYSEISMPSYRKHPAWAKQFDQVKVEGIPEKRFRFFADYDYRKGRPSNEGQLHNDYLHVDNARSNPKIDHTNTDMTLSPR